MNRQLTDQLNPLNIEMIRARLFDLFYLPTLVPSPQFRRLRSQDTNRARAPLARALFAGDVVLARQARGRRPRPRVADEAQGFVAGGFCI